MFGHMGKQLADGRPTLPMTLKPERRAKEVAGLARDHARLREWQGPAVVALQEWLVIEGVDLRGTAVHEEEDHPVGARGEVRRVRGERVAGIGLTGT